MAYSPSNPGNKPKNPQQYGNGYEAVKKPSGVKSGSQYGATTADNNKTATRGGMGISPAVGSVK